jgi:hypothetical protein
MAEAKFRGLQEAEDLRRRGEVRDWLAAANVEEDQEVKASVRAEYHGVCEWILDHKLIQAWRNSNAHSLPLLWIQGIPGAGKSFSLSPLRQRALFGGDGKC